MRLCIIGGAGYIGSHVAAAFQERGDSVTVFDDLSTGRRENVGKGALFLRGSILDVSALRSCFSAGFDAIVHLAAKKAAGDSMVRPEIYAENNLNGTVNILNEAMTAGIRFCVFSSSAAVYGEPEYLPVDEKHPTRPENFYGYTKLAIEQLLGWYDTLKGFRSASLRYFNAAGYDPSGKITGLEQSPANLVPVIMEVASGMRDSLKVFGTDYPTPDGTGIRDYVHVTDLASAHVKALDYITRNDASLTVNLGSENGISVLEMLETARRGTGRPIPAELTGRRAGDPAKLVASSRAAETILGWKAVHSDPETLVRTTWNAYLASGVARRIP